MPATDIDVTRFMKLSSISNKYNFRDHFLWSIEILTTFLKSRDEYLDNCTTSMLEGLLALSVAGEMKEMKEMIIDKWMKRFRTDDDALLSALIFAEKHGLSQFLGHAYYEQMLRIYTHRPNSGNSANHRVQHLGSLDLGSVHTNRLNQGFLSLTLEAIRISELDVHCACANDRCGTAWKEFQKNSTLQIRRASRPSDVLAWLYSALSHYDTIFAPCCEVLLTTELDSLEANLVYHFIGYPSA